jgi:hypothetical protein
MPTTTIVQLEESQLKNPMTSAGIKPETIQLVVQCLNQLLYCVPIAQQITVLIRKEF